MKFEEWIQYEHIRLENKKRQISEDIRQSKQKKPSSSKPKPLITDRKSPNHPNQPPIPS